MHSISKEAAAEIELLSADNLRLRAALAAAVNRLLAALEPAP